MQKIGPNCETWKGRKLVQKLKLEHTPSKDKRQKNSNKIRTFFTQLLISLCHDELLIVLVKFTISFLNFLKCYYDENHIFSIEAILRHKQVACMRRKMLFTIFKYLFLFQRYSSFFLQISLVRFY